MQFMKKLLRNVNFIIFKNSVILALLHIMIFCQESFSDRRHYCNLFETFEM